MGGGDGVGWEREVYGGVVVRGVAVRGYLCNLGGFRGESCLEARAYLFCLQLCCRVPCPHSRGGSEIGGRG